MRMRKLLNGLALLCLAGGVAAARLVLSPTITPTSHDFGDNVVGVAGNWFNFTVTVPAGGGPTGSVRALITGPDAAEFRIRPGARGLIPGATPAHLLPACQDMPSLPAGTCEIAIEFIPTTLGPKTASLRVVDQVGMVSATLKGTGVYGCRMEVVPCNYSAFYSGTISWVSTSHYSASSPNGTVMSLLKEDVTATITNGRAICSGTVREDRTDTSGDGSKGWLRAVVGMTGVSPPVVGTAPIAPPAIPDGLFAVEFDRDTVIKDYYLVTIACPSMEGTDSSMNVKYGGKDGNDIKSTPAELDGREMTSERQPATLGIGMDLQGQINFPHPNPEPGLSGTTVITWKLTGQRPPPNWGPRFPRRPPPP